jgi:hypothetical protein
MNKEKALIIMQESLYGMQRSGLIKGKVVVDESTVLLGSDLILDSLGFVTFISDIEERITIETGQDYFIVLSDIHAEGDNEVTLTTGVLALYIEKLTEDQ